MNNTTSALIEQLIDRTKAGELSWKPYSNFESDLKPIYTSPLDSNTVSKTITNINISTITPEDGYVCTYNNGYFFLLLYRRWISDVEIVLRVQTKISKNSKICASTSEDNLQISAQLKRLYNLVENAPSLTEIDNFINDFISHK